VHPTGGSRRVFELFSWLEVGFVKMASSRPAHQRVTPTVGWLPFLDKYEDENAYDHVRKIRIMLCQAKKRHLLIVGVTLGVLLCFFGGVVIISKYLSVGKAYDKHYLSEKSPIRILSIEIDENQREEFFDQLRKFSEKHSLEFRLSYYENGKVFFVEMYGKGLEILALSKPIDTRELDILLFEKDPANPPTHEIVDALFDDLRSYIFEIPRVKITREK
jgi:hypothetical protein